MFDAILTILPYVVIALLVAGCVKLLIVITNLQRDLLFTRAGLKIAEERLVVAQTISEGRHETIQHLRQQINELLSKS